MGCDHAGGDAALPTQLSSSGRVGAAFPDRVKDAFGRVGEVSVKGRHLVLGDGILKVLDGQLLGRAGGVGVCEGEDMLGEGQQRPFRVLRIGAHFVVVMGYLLLLEMGERVCQWKTDVVSVSVVPSRSTPLEFGKQLCMEGGCRPEMASFVVLECFRN